MGTFIADLVLQILFFVADSEGSNIRQEQGIAAAKANGVRFSRPEMPVPDNFNEIAEKFENKKIKLKEAVKKSGMSQSTFYRRLREYQVQCKE